MANEMLVAAVIVRDACVERARNISSMKQRGRRRETDDAATCICSLLGDTTTPRSHDTFTVQAQAYSACATVAG